MASLTLNPEDGREPSNVDEDDDVPQLSANTAAALQEFLQERLVQRQEEEEESAAAMTALQIDDHKQQQQQQQLRHVSEDWQLSQFWYTESTAAALAKEALRAAGDGGRVACVSCPTLYKAIVDAVKEEKEASAATATETAASAATAASPSACRAVVLEFDRRFAKWGRDFVFYDYKDASIPELPVDWRQSFDVVVCDPPFLTEDCASATLRAAVDTLGKKRSMEPSASASCKVMFCTGEIMAETLTKLSDGALRKSETFAPEHASKLSNPFVLMTNFMTTTL